VADAVWDEALAGHAGAGTAGKALADVLVDTAEIGTAGAGLTNINLPDQTMNITGNITGNLSGSVGSVTTVSDKTGYALAADGLDAISTTAPAGAASNFREMMVQTWRRFFKKATMTSSELKTWDDAGTSVVTTQALSDDGTTQTQGAAS